jgi:hypothetical protein
MSQAGPKAQSERRLAAVKIIGRTRLRALRATLFDFDTHSVESDVLKALVANA